ncbi:MAG TPA: ATP-dependent Clp protease adapter ClpS [Polyangiaceae bacterium]|nr:ATP-dependent Clp protease adapter ClpS [Polyangiaceae bacterium]
MSDDPRRRFEDDGELATDEKKRTSKPKQYKVVLHNDNYTTMEFVVLILMKFFRKSETEATHIMLTVHHKGTGIAGIYSKDVAETKVHQVTTFAQDHGMPLKLTTEPAD